MKNKQTNKQTNGAISRRLIIIVLVAAIGFSMAGCGDLDPGGGGPQKATYVSTDDNGNKYTLEIDESGTRSARSAAQQGDTFKLTVEYSTAFGGGNLNMKFEYEGTVGRAQTSGATVSLTLNINGERITITIVGTQMTVITGKIVDPNNGNVVSDDPGDLTPVIPNHTHTYSTTWSHNETQHWKECTAYDGAKISVGNHSGSPCTVCGYSSGPAINLSLDGVWRDTNGVRVVTISGSTGTLTSINTTSPLFVDAINKGYLAVGTIHWRNLTSRTDLTWNGQWSGVTYSTSNPNVATGTSWVSGVWTLSADGQTLLVGDREGEAGSTWTRQSNEK
jgi:hypothetical protein